MKKANEEYKKNPNMTSSENIKNLQKLVTEKLKEL